MNDPTSRAPKEKKPLYRISIRMTSEERKIIGQKATRVHLSLSRFLVESALSDEVITPQDKARLRWLLSLFEKMSDRLRSLSDCPALLRAEPAVRQELTAALHLVEALMQEMRKRLG